MASTNEAPSTTRSDITTTEPEDSSNEKGTVTTEDRERKTGESAASPIMTAPRKRSSDDAKIDTVESTGKKCHRTEEDKGDEPATKCGYNTPIRTLHDNLHKFDYKTMEEIWHTGDLGKYIDALEMGNKCGDPETKELASKTLHYVKNLRFMRMHPDEEEGDDSAILRRTPQNIRELHDLTYSPSDMQRVWRTGELDKHIKTLEWAEEHGDHESNELAKLALLRIRIMEPCYAW